MGEVPTGDLPGPLTADHSGSRVTARELLFRAGHRQGLAAERLASRIVTLSERFGLDCDAERPVEALAPPARRALGLAAALVHDPPVLLLDEPTAGLDACSKAWLREQIACLCHDEGRTVFLTTQDPAEAGRLASHVAVLDRGRVVAIGAVGAVGDALGVASRAGRRAPLPVGPAAGVGRR